MGPPNVRLWRKRDFATEDDDCAPRAKNFLKFWEICQITKKISISLFEKGVLDLRQADTIKPRKIEGSVFFQLDHNGPT